MRFLSRLRSLRQEEQITINTAKLRARQEQQLSLLQGHTQNIELSFLNSKIEELVKIKNQKVFNSFSTRCLNPQIRALNALADVNIERVFDKKAQNKVPFTVKDHLKVEGMIETCGFADNLKPSIVSSEVVQLLQAQNCIAFAHSNVPQGLLGIQSNNSVFGLCRNPHNSNFVSGGSSGGEAVLVASKATSFGVGSDSGGSARIPAAFCGVYGFKPTGSKRLSVKGRVGPSGVQGVKLGGVDSSFGFITRNFDDIVWLCAKTLGRKVQKEVTQLYGGLWDESRFQAAKRKKLKIGYLYENQEMKTAPGIKNSISQTLQLLKSQGHHVAQFKFPKLHHFRNFFFEFVYQTGFLKALAQRTKGHIPSPQAQDFYLIGSEGLAGVPQQLKQEQVLKDMHRIYSREQSTWQFFRIHREVGDLKEQFLKQWKAQELDILITPVMPFTAPLPGTSDLLVYQLTYCSFQNVLELPAGSIPTRLVNQSQTHYEPSNAYEKRVAESIKQSKGLPIGIQVTGSHLQDEECLGAMWQIQKLVGNYIQPSFLRSKN